MEQILNKMRDEIMEFREQNRVHSRKNNNEVYAENTMYIAGIYKAMSIISDFIRQELDLLDKWSDEKQKGISN